MLDDSRLSNRRWNLTKFIWLIRDVIVCLWPHSLITLNIMGKDVKSKLLGTEVTDRASAALSKAQRKNTLMGLSRSQLRDALAPMQQQLDAVLPKHLTGERMMQIIVNAIDRKPDIKECELSSVIGAIMQSSILGFKPVDSLGQVYFVPYNDRKTGKKYLQMQIGYKGYIDLARRSGQIKMLYAHVVREGDHFKYEFGLEEKLEHIPGDNPDGEITHVYAVAHYKDGGYNFIVLTRSQIEKLRTRNPTQGAVPSQAWKTDYDKMAMAKAIKQLSTFMPLSDEMQSAVASDEGIVNLTEDTVSLDQDIFYPDVEPQEAVVDMTQLNFDDNDETNI